MNVNMKAIFSGSPVTQPSVNRASEATCGIGAGLGRAAIFFICLIISACTAVPPRPFSSSIPPLEFIDYIPMEAGVLQRVSLHFGYEIETPATSRPFLVIYYLDLETEQKEPLATIEIDGIVVNEYSRKSILAVSWDEKTLLYMHDQTSSGPESLRDKPSGLYEYVYERGDRLIYPQAGIISHSSFQLTRNSIEFALGDPNDPTTEHYIRTTEGIEFIQEDAFILQYGGTELHRAAGKGETFRVQRLLKSGLDLEARDNRGFTPLHTAIWEGHEEMAKLLIEAGADVNANMLGTQFWTPLETATRFGLVNTINRLLDHGANINSTTFSGATPLHLALDYNQFQAAETLLIRGADVNVMTEKGSTPLQVFSTGLRDERSDGWSTSQTKALLKLLLAKGADVTTKNEEGLTALHYAVLRNNLRTAQILVENGANANVMELPDRHYYERELHHEGSKMTLLQRMNETLDSVWWKQKHGMGVNN